jgi:hypothetical protein
MKKKDIVPQKMKKTFHVENYVNTSVDWLLKQYESYEEIVKLVYYLNEHPTISSYYLIETGNEVSIDFHIHHGYEKHFVRNYIISKKSYKLLPSIRDLDDIKNLKEALQYCLLISMRNSNK